MRPPPPRRPTPRPATAISSSTVAPSPSATIWPREVGADLAERGGERRRAQRPLDAARAVREQHDRVVRRALAVDRDPVEARVDGGAEEAARLARLERVVGRDDRQHRREAGMDHPRALRHPADGEPAARDGRLLRAAVGREDRAGRGRAAVRRERRGRVRTPASSRSSGSGTPMTPVERTSTCSGARPSAARPRAAVALGVRDPALAGRGVRDARVDDDGLRLGEPRDAACETTHRRGVHAVRRAHRRADRRGGRADEREVRRRPADAGVDAARDEALRGRDRHQTSTPESRRPVGLLEPNSEVDVLHRLARRALAEVVERADDDRAAGRASSKTPISAPSVCWTRASSGTTPSGKHVDDVARRRSAPRGARAGRRPERT